MDWLLVVLLMVARPDGSEVSVSHREAVRSEIACRTAIMKQLDIKGQRVVEAECIHNKTARLSGQPVQLASSNADRAVRR